MILVLCWLVRVPNLLHDSCKYSFAPAYATMFVKQQLMGEGRKEAGEKEEEAAALPTRNARCCISVLHPSLHSTSLIFLAMLWMAEGLHLNRQQFVGKELP